MKKRLLFLACMTGMCCAGAAVINDYTVKVDEVAESELPSSGRAMLRLSTVTTVCNTCDEVAIDTVCTDTTTMTNSVPQVPLGQYEKIEQSDNPRYAYVYKDGLCGIYDLEAKRNVTKIEFDSLGVRNRTESEFGPITVFTYTKDGGHGQGLISLLEDTGTFVSIGM